MDSFLRTLSARQLLLTEAPGLLLSLAVAERFYKFHSFTLECAAFLATWWACGFTARVLSRRGRRSGSSG
jgi:hypothetical protein